MNYRILARKLFFLIALLAPFLAWSEQRCTLTLSGTVIEDGENMPLPGATITLSEVKKSAITDQKGHFHFHDLCPGVYHAELSYIGFAGRKLSFELNKDQEVILSLQHDQEQLAEVVVISEAGEVKHIQAQSELKGMELELTRGQSLGESLKRVPGVSSIQTGPSISKPVIHGMHSNRVLIFNSGVRLEGQQWGSEHAPEADPFLANQVTVVKGAGSVQYGADALGGIILVEPEPLNFHKRFSGGANLVAAENSRMGVLSGKLQGALKNEHWAWRIQGTAKRAGNAKTADYFLENTGFEELNGSATLGFRKDKFAAELFFSSFNTSLGIFKGAHIGSLEDLENSIQRGRPATDGAFGYDIDVPRQQVGHQLVKLSARQYFENNGTLSFNYSFQQNHRQEYDLRRGGRDALAALDLKLMAQNADIVYQSPLRNQLSSKVGLSLGSIVNNNVPGTLVTPLIPNYDNINIGIFAIERLEKAKYSLEAGLRYDYRFLDALGYDKDETLYGGTHRFHNLSASLGGTYHISRHLDFLSNFSLAWRPPTVNELYSNGLHHGSAAVEIGEENLQSEKGYKWINTLSFRSGKLSAEWSGYGQYVSDYIFLNPSGEFLESLRGSFPVFNYQQTDASFLGIDLSASLVISPALEWILKGALIRARDQTNKRFLPMIPADRLENALRWNLKSEKWTKPFVELQHIYVARQNRYDEGSDFAAPPQAYYLLNLSAGFSHLGEASQWSLSATAYNLLNNRYKDYLNRFRYYGHEVGRNIVLRLAYNF